jgi:hypothetical protein
VVTSSGGSDWLEQARRLMEALRAAGPAAPPAPGGGGSTSGGSAGGGDCRWCPLCQAAAVLRGERPEVTAALADVLSATAAALRQFAGEPAAAPSSTGTAAAGTAAAGTVADDGGQPDPAVQRIELA